MTDTKRKYTVSGLNQAVRQALESQFGRVWLVGEISNLVIPSSGHWYFTLKDAKAQVRCAMFRGRNQYVRFQPQNGQQITLRAQISLYEPRGDYQLIAESMIPDGEGLLQLQYEALKKKLSQQGLFALEHKKVLPHITRLGVITSATGAALQDVLHVLKRRAPQIEVIVYAVTVQGSEAPASLIKAFESAQKRKEVDALLLTRGGGSLEDLNCFNSEQLAHVIHECTLPVISAVGHEIDTTIADLVADLRAPTPSAGAEVLSEDHIQGQQILLQLRHKLERSWAHFILQQQARFQHLQAQFAALHPKSAIEQKQQRLDKHSIKIQQAMLGRIHLQQELLHQHHKKMIQYQPSSTLEHMMQALQHYQTRMHRSVQSTLTQQAEQLKHYTAELEHLSPLATLQRGYTLNFVEKKSVNSVRFIKEGDTLETQLKDGWVTSTVTQMHPNKTSTLLPDS